MKTISTEKREDWDETPQSILKVSSLRPQEIIE